MLREVKHLSSLNHPHIVRYYQTWVEAERNPDIIEEFQSSDDYGDYDSEEEIDESTI
jgi:serine/threonine protein kinase